VHEQVVKMMGEGGKGEERMIRADEGAGATMCCGFRGGIRSRRMGILRWLGEGQTDYEAMTTRSNKQPRV